MSASIYPVGLYLVLIGIDENIAALTYGTIVPLFLGALLLCLGSARDLYEALSTDERQRSGCLNLQRRK